MKKDIKWRFALSKYNILILLIGLSINLLGKFLTSHVTLPFWLDSIGTICTAASLGPLGGAIVGGLSNVFFAFQDPVNLFYALINILIGILIGIYYPKDRTDYFQIVYTAAIIAMTTVILCTPLNLLLYNGYTGNVWGDALCDMLSQSVSAKTFCAALGEAFVDLPDKVLSMFLATAILHLLDKITNITSSNHNDTENETKDHIDNQKRGGKKKDANTESN